MKEQFLLGRMIGSQEITGVGEGIGCDEITGDEYEGI